MRRGSPGAGTAAFLIRNLVLLFLMVNGYAQLREQLDLAFQCAALLLGVLTALWMERGRLRFLPALLLAAAVPLALRMVFFLVFRFQRLAAPGEGSDFLFLLFDKDFPAAVMVFAVAWLFNFLALRRRGFVVMEICANALLAVGVFWGQAGFRLTLYPHPSLMAAALAAFIVAELFVLLLTWPRGAEGTRLTARSLLSFSWMVLPLLLVLLSFVLGAYRERAVQAGGGLMKPTLFRFDFSPYVRLESEISMSKDLVMLFRTPGKADRWLLTRFILPAYDARRGFSVERGKGIDEPPTTVPDSPESFPDPGYTHRESVPQEYFFLSIDPSSLIALDYPVQVVPLRNWKSSSFLRVYRVLSRASRSPEAPARVRSPPVLGPALQAYYTGYGGDQRIRELALSVTKAASGYYGRVKSIEEYLKANYLYSLRPGIAADGDQLRHFLFDSRKGYCSYFAFSMALMCRSLGIPARVAVGFAVDPGMEVLNFYEVRAFQAHAWVEVYFGDLGWIQFDPTSENLAPGEDFSLFQGPDKEKLSRLIREILDNEGSLAEEQAPPTAPDPARMAVGGIVRTFWLLARLWYVTLPALYLLILFCAKLLPLLPALLSRRPRRRARGRWRLALMLLSGTGISRKTGESALEYSGRIQPAGIRLTPLAEVYLKSAFGDRFDHEDMGALRSAWGELARSRRERIPVSLRILGLLNPLGSAGRESARGGSA
jgi:protein-glutamine gamma-glutamyltransferase